MKLLEFYVCAVVFLQYSISINYHSAKYKNFSLLSKYKHQRQSLSRHAFYPRLTGRTKQLYQEQVSIFGWKPTLHVIRTLLSTILPYQA